MTAAREVRVALVGQPNVGKSTLFNMLTGETVRVANWPGTTVVKYEGELEHRGRRIYVVDLPGTYGLSSLTMEEVITRNFILSGGADVYVVLVDATIPERTLTLAMQVLELTDRVVVAFTKMDMAHSWGVHIDITGFSRELRVPVVGVSARTGYGIQELLDAVIDVAEGRVRTERFTFPYGMLEPYIESLERELEARKVSLKFPRRWAIVKLLEGDVEVDRELSKIIGPSIVEGLREEARRHIGRDLPGYIASLRFSHIMRICERLILRRQVTPAVPKYAHIFYSPVFGPIASVGIILGLLTIAFTINTGFPLTLILELAGLESAAETLESYSLSSLIEAFFELLGENVEKLLGEGILTSLIVDGALSGVGAVLTFLPLIAIVSAGYAVLDDSGLLPRIAVGVHRALSMVGLSGHSIFPMITSFGCNVPGILAARTALNPWERLKLILTLPFIPCQARLVVLLALAVGMGPLGGFYVIAAYLIALFVFIALNAILNKLSRQERQVEILLELPPIHTPFLRVIWWTTWSHVKHFLIRAGTIILGASIIIWFLTSFDTGLNYTTDITESIAGKLAATISPLLSPLGLTGTQAIIIILSLMIGFIAKELFIAALLVATGAETISKALASLELAPTQIAPLMVFTVLYVPCLATLATMYMESGSAKLTLSVTILMLAIAYAFALLVYGLLQAF